MPSHRERATEEKEKAVGKFKKGANDQQLKVDIFDNHAGDDYILRQIDHLSATIRDCGEKSAKEILVMLSAFLCDPDNAEIVSHYWKKLGEK